MDLPGGINPGPQRCGYPSACSEQDRHRLPEECAMRNGKI